jgi:hypothetical protein
VEKTQPLNNTIHYKIQNNHTIYYLRWKNMIELIEQQEQNIKKSGDSKYILLTPRWIEKLEINNQSIIVVRLCRGKKGLFIDAFKKE